jgi:hypothetical protein
VGTIDDFTIKPIKQHLYLLSGFSRHVSSRPSFSSTTLSTTTEADRDHVDATRTRPKEGRAVDTGALTSRGSEPSSGDDDGGLSDSDPDLSSDDDGCSSEGGLGRSSTRMNIPWGVLDEQRLLAWKKEGKPWKWIFKKFPGRTPAAVCTRWTMVQYSTESSKLPPTGGHAAAQALCAYLPLGICWNECLKGPHSSFCWPAPSREQLWSREAAFKARSIGGIRYRSTIPQKKKK